MRLEDDTVHIQIMVSEAFRTSASPLRLALSLSERSQYPATSGLIFVEDGGSETIDAMVEEVAATLTEDVRLHRVLRKLCEVFMVEARLPAAPGAAAAAADDAGDGPADMSGDDSDSADDDSDEADDDYGYDRVLEEDNWETLQRTKRRWDIKEQERTGKRRAVEGVAGGGRPSPVPAAVPAPRAAAAARDAPKNEMFNSRESFRMLSNELEQLIRKTNQRDSTVVSAEAVNDDVHHWRVRAGRFKGALGEELNQIEAMYGYNHVEIELIFTPDLHPFYPPQVRIVRPRFKGWILGAVMTHPMFVLDGWDPMRSTADVVEHVRALLQSFGRLELETDRNNPAAFPVSAYSPLENVLVRMELLTSTRPLAADRYPELYRDRDKEINKERLKVFRDLAKKDPSKEEKEAAAKKDAKKYWASGTGYGHGSSGGGNVWDSAAAMAAQRHQDQLRAKVLNELLSSSFPRQDSAGGGAAAAAAADGGGAAGACLLSELVDIGERERDFVLDSCLIPFLEAEVKNTTLQDMGVRFDYYTAVVQAAQHCLRLEWLRPHLNQLTKGLTELAQQSTMFQISVGPSSATSRFSNDGRT